VTLHALQLKGGVIVDVVNVEQARIAEEAGACAVMALERVPADIRAEGGVARMSDPKMIKDIIAAVSIPVMAKVRIGHFVEAQVSSSFLFWAKASSSSSPASLWLDPQLTLFCLSPSRSSPRSVSITLMNRRSSHRPMIRFVSFPICSDGSCFSFLFNHT
jgi:hypothetical protein